MAELNQKDTERVMAITDLIHDQITDTLHNDSDLAGELDNSVDEEIDVVRFLFTDGRHVTVRVSMDPPTS